MAVFMFSLAGIPPMVGFFAKLAVLQALVSTNVPAYIMLAVFAVLMSLIGAYYYLRVIKVMYFDKAETDVPLVMRGGARVAISLNGLAMLALGLFPASLLGLCQAAFP